MQHCIVEISSSDRQGFTAARAAFSSSKAGHTTLSSSGLVLGGARSDRSSSTGPSTTPAFTWVLAPASLLLPFIQLHARARLDMVTSDDLAPTTALHVTFPAQPHVSTPPGHKAPRLPACLVTMIQCQQALAQGQRALRNLNDGGGPAWRVAWWLEQGRQVGAYCCFILGVRGMLPGTAQHRHNTADAICAVSGMGSDPAARVYLPACSSVCS